MTSKETLPLWLLLAALLVPALGLTSPLLEVDDARYAEVPREMAASGDWVLPTLDATPYVEKPPLWYWIDAASQKVLGSSEASARLPMLVLALLGAAGAWWLGGWLYDERVGRIAAAATGTSALWIFLVHNLTLDMPLSVCFIWTTAFILRTLMKPQDAFWAAPAAWACAALAFLDKGLIAVVFPVAWVLGLAVMFPKMRRGALALATSWGMPLAAAITAPWFFAMQRRRPDFLHVFFIEQHFQRFLTQKYHRNAPAWFYLAVLPGGLLPWTAPALSGLWRAVRRPLGPDARGPALAAWSLGVTAFFSISHSKLATYVLPVFPHMAILAAAELERGLPRAAARAQAALGSVLLCAAGVLAAVAIFSPTARAAALAFMSAPRAGLLAALAVGLLAAMGAAMLLAPRLSRPAAALCAGAALAGVCLFGGLRLAAPLVSAREVGLAVRAQIRPGDELWTYDTYLHGLPFYCGRRVDRIVQFLGEFHYAKRDPAYAPMFRDDSALSELPRAGGRTFVAMKSRSFDHFIASVKGGGGALEAVEPLGAWTLAVVGAEPPR